MDEVTDSILARALARREKELQEDIRLQRLEREREMEREREELRREEDLARQERLDREERLAERERWEPTTFSETVPVIIAYHIWGRKRGLVRNGYGMYRVKPPLAMENTIVKVDYFSKFELCCC